MSEHPAPSEDALIDAALAVLDQAPLPTSPLPEPEREPVEAAATAEAAQAWAPLPPASPTLGALDASRRPKASTVCEECPNSVWFASPAEVQCYCRVMFLVTWSSKAPNQITHCDGAFLGQGE